MQLEKANARSTGNVYWGTAQRLALTEVTEGNALTNGAKKCTKSTHLKIKVNM